MAKQTWKPGNMIYPIPAVMVSVTDGKGQDDIITVAWTGTICTNPPMAYISVRPERFFLSHDKRNRRIRDQSDNRRTCCSNGLLWSQIRT